MESYCLLEIDFGEFIVDIIVEDNQVQPHSVN